MNPLQDEEWLKARCGKVGASSIWRVMARTRTGYGAERANYMAELVCERLTGKPTDGYKSAAMVHGIETEPQARAAYEFISDAAVALSGWVPHPGMPSDAGASPDGLVGDDGLVEIKCPQPAGHLETLLGGAVPDKYIKQMYWQMICTERQWCDFVSFQPSFPEDLQLHITRIHRPPHDMVSEIETEVRKFLTEIDAKIAALSKRLEAA